MDARASGYSAPSLHLDPNTVGFSLPPIGPLSFLSGTRVAVAFVNRAASGSLAHRGGSPAGLPLRLHVLFVDAQTGRLTASQEWATASFGSRIVPVGAGRFVVVEPSKMTLYSPDSTPLRTLHVPIEVRVAGRVLGPASPTGRYITLEYSDGWSECLIVNTQSLRVVRTWLREIPKTCSAQAADDGSLLSESADGGLEIGTLRGPPSRVLCQSFYSWRCPYGGFVADDALFRVQRSGMDWVLYLMHSDGQPYFVLSLPDNEYVAATAPCASGRRFAMAIDRGKGGSTFFDIAPHYSMYRIVVYDIHAQKWMYAVDCKKGGHKIYLWSCPFPRRRAVGSDQPGRNTGGLPVARLRTKLRPAGSLPAAYTEAPGGCPWPISQFLR